MATCYNCGRPLAEHDRDGRCQRDISQPVSRVVAGFPCLICEAHPCECAAPLLLDGQPPSSSYIRDVAAFRALSAEQRAALLKIGEDAPALLLAAHETRRGLYGAGDRLADALKRIDARKV